MARTLKNRVRETTATTGTGDITPSGATARYRSFASSGLVAGALVPYLIEVPSGAWEIGTGTYTATGTVQRTTFEDSSTGAVLTLTGEAGTTISITASTAAFAEIVATAASNGLPAVTIANTVTAFAQTDLLPINQAGTVNYVTAQTLVGGKTIDRLDPAGPITTATIFPVVQGNSTSLGATMAQLSTFTLAQQVNYRRPKIEVSTGSIAMDTTNAGAAFVFTAAGTLSFSAITNMTTAGALYEALVIADGGIVSFGAGITTTGTATLADGQTATIRGYTRNDGSVRVIATTPAVAAAATPAATMAAPTVTGLVAGGTTTVSGSFANGTPTGLTYKLDAGSAVGAVTPTIGASTYSFSFTTPAANTHTITVTGTGGNTATSPSTAFTITAAATGPAFPMTFAGAAGATTGVQALTQIGTNSTASFGLDGVGDLLLPSVAYATGFFAAAGKLPAVCRVTATFKAGTSNRELVLILRHDGASTYYSVLLTGGVGYFSRCVAGTSATYATLSVAIPSTSSTVTYYIDVNGFTGVLVDGVYVNGTPEGNTIAAGGYVGIGSGALVSPITTLTKLDIV